MQEFNRRNFDQFPPHGMDRRYFNPQMDQRGPQMDQRVQPNLMDEPPRNMPPRMMGPDDHFRGPRRQDDHFRGPDRNPEPFRCPDATFRDDPFRGPKEHFDGPQPGFRGPNDQFRGPPPQNNNFRGPHPQNPQQPIRPQHIQDGPIRPQHIQEVPPKLEGPPVFAVPTTAPSKPMPMEISQPRSIDEGLFDFILN